jgi:hypothetical protein
LREEAVLNLAVALILKIHGFLWRKVATSVCIYTNIDWVVKNFLERQKHIFGV